MTDTGDIEDTGDMDDAGIPAESHSRVQRISGWLKRR